MNTALTLIKARVNREEPDGLLESFTAGPMTLTLQTPDEFARSYMSSKYEGEVTIGPIRFTATVSLTSVAIHLFCGEHCSAYASDSLDIESWSSGNPPPYGKIKHFISSVIEDTLASLPKFAALRAVKSIGGNSVELSYGGYTRYLGQMAAIGWKLIDYPEIEFSFNALNAFVSFSTRYVVKHVLPVDISKQSPVEIIESIGSYLNKLGFPGDKQAEIDVVLRDKRLNKGKRMLRYNVKDYRMALEQLKVVLEKHKVSASLQRGTLALSIVQARVNNERQLDMMTVEKAFDIYREYENFPPVFTYKGLKFIKFGESDSETTRKKFAKVIREIDVDGSADTHEFEYVNHGTNYKGFSISFEQSEDSSDDNVCNVQVSDNPSRDFRIDRPGSADLLKAALDQAIAKIDAAETGVPRWAKSSVTVLGKTVKFKIEINSDGSLLIRGRSGWSKSIDISHETSSDAIRVSISAKPVGQTSNRSFVFKIPVSVAESGKLSSKINELCAAKKIYAKPPVDATVVSVDVGGFKQEFKVNDAIAFKRHLLQYLKGN